MEEITPKNNCSPISNVIQLCVWYHSELKFNVKPGMLQYTYKDKITAMVGIINDYLSR